MVFLIVILPNQNNYSTSIVYNIIINFSFSHEEFSESTIIECADKLNRLYPRWYNHIPIHSVIRIVLSVKVIQVRLTKGNLVFEFENNKKGQSVLKALEKMARFILGNFPVSLSCLQEEDINFDAITNGFNKLVVGDIVEIKFPPFAYENSKSFAEGIKYLKEDLKSQLGQNPNLKKRIQPNLSIAIFDRVDKNDPFRFLIEWAYSPGGIQYSITSPGDKIDYAVCRNLYGYIKYYFPEIISNTALFELDLHTRTFPISHWHNIEIRFDASAFKQDEVEEAIQHLEQKYLDLDKKLSNDCLVILGKGDSKYMIVSLPLFNQIFQVSDQDLYSSGEKTLFQSVKAKDLLEKVMRYLNDNIDGMKRTIAKGGASTVVSI